MIDPNLVIGAGKEMASLINKVIDQRKINENNDIFKFKRLYEEEKKRPDRDHDDLLKWQHTNQLLIKTILEEIRPSK